MLESDIPAGDAVGTLQAAGRTPSAPTTARPIPGASASSARPARVAVAKVTVEHVAVTRLIGRGCHVSLPALGADATLTLRLAENPSASWEHTLRVNGRFGSIDLAEGARLLRALGDIDLGGEQSADAERWEWLQAALVGRLGQSPFAGVESVESAPPPHGAGAMVLQCALRSSHHAFTTYARATPAAWLRFIGAGAWAKDGCAHTALLALPVPPTVLLARHTLPAGAAGRLQDGDIVLPDSPRFNCDGEGLLDIGRNTLRVRFRAPGAFEVIAMEDKLDQDDYAEDVGDADEYNDDMRGVNHDAAEQVESFDAVEPPEEERFEPPLKASAAPGLAAADGADAVPVVLDFVMGKVRLSLGDLRTLGPGTILTIDGGSPASIQVISGGHVLGRGEAVDVGGQLGIRIVDWTAR